MTPRPRRDGGVTAFAALLLAALAAGRAGAADDLATVAELDLARYMGAWHQVAHLPNRFQDFCAGDTRADYSLRADGRVDVVNQCRDAAGELHRAVGMARINARYDDPARLEVRFAPAWLAFLPFVWGDYWILALTPDYGAVLVGAPDRDYLWILARAPSLDAATYAGFVERAAGAGFAVERLVLEHDAAVLPATAPSRPRD
ncbi:MAG: lipocalin family protein [Gammaproteobacteria bacterium]